MRKEVPIMNDEIKGTKKEFLDLFQKLCYSRQSWQVWSDLMTTFACSISNAVDRTPEHFEEREKQYMHSIASLGNDVDIVAKMFAIVTIALESNPDQDFLGELYMELGIGSHYHGQFFTPYSVCQLMADTQMEDANKAVEKNGYISICDPACGAGATLLAAANKMRKHRKDFQMRTLFVGQDIDSVAAKMCYIQLSLLGCAGYVCVGNTLTNPLVGHELFPKENKGQELWYTPMFMSDVWDGRRRVEILKNFMDSVEPHSSKSDGYVFWFDFEGGNNNARIEEKVG